MPVTIGNRVLVGPNVQFYAATHPIRPEERQGSVGREYSKPIVIEDDCWQVPLRYTYVLANEEYAGSEEQL